MLLQCLEDLEHVIKGEPVTTKIKKIFPRRKLFTSLTLVAAAITLLALGYFASAPTGVSYKST